MELYLDSADLKEIEEAFQLGFVKGLTTTPTFMHRHGVTDIDALIIKLAGMVPILQIEALGKTTDEIVAEAHRQLNLGLDPKKTVFKIPISVDGVKACYQLRQQDMLVNIHLIYTLQQAYMALEAGANFVCPLVGRLQDQGHDALDVVDQIVNAVEVYGYDSKVMFSSVRHPEHVRNAINLGVHVCTIPWKVMKQLTENAFTSIGTEQFFEHTRMMTVKVKEIVGRLNPQVTMDDSLTDALVKMTESGYGCVSVMNGNGKYHRITNLIEMIKASWIYNEVVIAKGIAPFCQDDVVITNRLCFSCRFCHVLRSQELSVFQVHHLLRQID